MPIAGKLFTGTRGSDELPSGPFSPRNPVNNFPPGSCHLAEPGGSGKPCPVARLWRLVAPLLAARAGHGTREEKKIAPAGNNCLPNRCRNCHHSPR